MPVQEWIIPNLFDTDHELFRITARCQRCDCRLEFEQAVDTHTTPTRAVWQSLRHTLRAVDPQTIRNLNDERRRKEGTIS